MILKETTTVEIHKDGRVLAVISYDKDKGVYKITPNSAEHVILSCFENKEVENGNK